MLNGSIHYKYCVYVNAVCVCRDEGITVRDLYDELWSSFRLTKREVLVRFLKGHSPLKSCDIVSLDIREEAYFD